MFADKLPKKGTTKSTFLGLSVRASSPRGTAADKITKLRAAAGAAGRTFATRISPARAAFGACSPQNLRGQGVAAANISRVYKPVAKRSMPLLGTHSAVEVKSRATGFAQLYDWLNDRDVLIGKADRQEPSVVLRLSLAAEIAKRMV
jgi:hypothetical protein